MSETTPKISVIVPVYKAENYLHRCVDSLLAQTFQDFEILLVDDGSPDRSGEICDEYARKDNRVRVFHKENGGVSSARQCGMDNAVGEYTIHADPDDWVEPNMLEELYKKAKEEDADMVICDFYEEREGKTIYVRQQPSSLEHETVLRELFQQLHGSCCNKLVRRVCYSRSGVKFPMELSFCEDLYVNACLVSKDVKIAYVNKAFYHYDQTVNAESLVHRPTAFILAQMKVLRTLLKSVLSQSFDAIYPYMLCNQALVILRGDKDCISSFLSDFADLKPLINKVDVPKKWKILLWLAFYISPNLANGLYKIWLSRI